MSLFFWSKGPASYFWEQSFFTHLGIKVGLRLTFGGGLLLGIYGKLKIATRLLAYSLQWIDLSKNMTV